MEAQLVTHVIIANKTHVIIVVIIANCADLGLYFLIYLNMIFKNLNRHQKKLNEL